VTAASVAGDHHTRPTEEIAYETPKGEPFRDVDNDNYDDEILEEVSKMFGREIGGSIATPYLMPYIYSRRFLDMQYCKRKDGVIFKIGDSAVLVDQDGDITIKEKEIRGSEGLWELLTSKRVNKEHVTSEDLRTHKKILLITIAHLWEYKPGGVINVSGGVKFREISAPLFAKPKPELWNWC